MISHSVGNLSDTLRTPLSRHQRPAAHRLLSALHNIHAARYSQPCGLLKDGPARSEALKALNKTRRLTRTAFAEHAQDTRLVTTLRDIVVAHVHGAEWQSEGVAALAAAGNESAVHAELTYRGLSASAIKDAAPWTRNLPHAARTSQLAVAPRTAPTPS